MQQHRFDHFEKESVVCLTWTGPYIFRYEKGIITCELPNFEMHHFLADFNCATVQVWTLAKW